MKTRMWWTVALAAVVGLTALPPTQAGDKKKEDNPFAQLPKPGPEHKLLAALEGTWTVKGKAFFGAEPTPTTGTTVRKMIMDGRYLQEVFQGHFGDMKFRGMGLTGYDVIKKKFVMTWIDNFGTGIYLTHGTFDDDTKTWTHLGQEDTPKGPMKSRDVLKLVSADEQQFDMYRTPPAGKEFKKVMEITYTRKK